LITTYSFAQIEPVEYQEFVNSNSISSAVQARFRVLSESPQHSVFVTANELFDSKDGGDITVVSVQPDAYGKLADISEKSNVEMITIFFNDGDALPSSTVLNQFPSLKYLFFQGQKVSSNTLRSISGPENGTLFVIFRIVGND
jgi:hypothetical protein